MKFRNFLISSVCSFLTLGAISVGSVANAAPVEDFAARPSLSGLRVSPDGKKVAYRVAQTRQGNYAIEVRDTGNLKKKPIRLGSEVMDIQGFQWIGDNQLLVTFTQKVRDQIKEQNRGVFERKRAMISADGKGRWKELYDDLSIASMLPNDPDNVLVRTSKFNQSDISKLREQGRSFDDLRNRDFYKMNTRTGALKRHLKSDSRMGSYGIDLKGNIRIANSYDPGSRNFITYIRDAKEGAHWKELYKANADNYGDRFSVLGFDSENEDIVFVSSSKNSDTQSIYEYNVNTKSFGEKIISVPGQDLERAVYSANAGEPGQVVGFPYYNKKGRLNTVFLDGKAEALDKSVKAVFPGKEVFITSRSRDDSVIGVVTQSWNDPGTFYVIKDGKANLIGKSRPQLNSQELSEQKYITYTARDGHKIPAYITVPKGPGPHPTVVMPHGGPWVSYRPGVFDEWSQMLANNGYLVIDPLFRGTTGLGTKHWLSSFGEWGKLMSDDMDDGFKYLVSQGLADPNKGAMFGWSFGGYSAFAASVREPQIYNCVIAGAGVSDPVLFRSAFSANRLLRPQLEKGYAGLRAVNRTQDVSVPVLVIHGELDQRVRIVHSEKFIDGLEKNNKPHKFVVLDGADHFDNTLQYEHRVEMYDEMIKFLKNDCNM